MLNCFKSSKQNYEPISSINVPHPNPVGVVRVVVQAANIRKRVLKPRPFVLIRMQGRLETKATSTVKTKTWFLAIMAHTSLTNWVDVYSHSPNWFSESSFILIVYSLEENLEFEVLNHHRFLKSGSIGHSVFSLALLKDDARRIGEESSIIGKDHKVNGTTLFDIFYYPVSSPREVPSTSCNALILTNRSAISLTLSLFFSDWSRHIASSTRKKLPMGTLPKQAS